MDDLTHFININSFHRICREHQISQNLFYRWRDRFLEGGQKGLGPGTLDEAKALQTEIEKLEKIIGRQTIAIETLKKTQDLISGKGEDDGVEGQSVQGVCET